ncbi:hypothetical protein I551_9168 [Mycobacterium ulcerans str. Harvey]|uniref:DUF4178 domain-containing protein n=1 Tax=Mycobacterium ulcerans str. Harvey TaxID=1299332 RepID=A0ABN0R8W4_MYCUL|nr:hypothetical protein I551_9168 [Mycobacterium ulcerans str. Harvey]
MGTRPVLLAVMLFIASIIVLTVALRRPKTPARPGQRQDPLAFNAMPQFGPRQLGPGAIVSYGGVDYVVRGSVTFREGPFVWWEHLLEGGDEPIWFSVEEDEGRLELAMWTKRTDLALQPSGVHVVDGSRSGKRSGDVPATPPRERQGCRPAGTWTMSTTSVPTSPRCWVSSAGRRTCRGRSPRVRPC